MHLFILRESKIAMGRYQFLDELPIKQYSCLV